VHSEGLDLLQSLEVEILQVTVAHFFARNSPLETSPRESNRGVAGELKIQAILAPDTSARHSSAGLSTGRQRAIRHRLQDENHGKRRALEVAEKDVDEKDVDAGALHCGDSGGKTKCDDGFVHVCVCDRVVQVGVMFASGVIDNMVVGGQSSVPPLAQKGDLRQRVAMQSRRKRRWIKRENQSPDSRKSFLSDCNVAKIRVLDLSHMSCHERRSVVRFVDVWRWGGSTSSGLPCCQSVRKIRPLCFP